MAAPSVTNTFSSSTTISSSQVNQNFTDIINGLTDGTEDLTINALTCNGAVIFGSTFNTGLTASRVMVTNGSQILAASSVTSTELGYLSGLTSTAQGTVRTTATKTTTYTATTSDQVIWADGSGGAWTLTLYTAVGNEGRELEIVKVDSAFDAITIDGNGSQTIGGSTTALLNLQYESIKVRSDGSNWQVVARYVPDCSVILSTANTTAIADSTTTYIGWGTTSHDPYSQVVNGGSANNTTYSSTTYINVQKPGRYRSSVLITPNDADLNSGESFLVYLTVDGVLFKRLVMIVGPVATFGASFSVVDDLAAGEDVSVAIYQTSGGNVTLETGGATYSEFSLHLVGY